VFVELWGAGRAAAARGGLERYRDDGSLERPRPRQRAPALDGYLVVATEASGTRWPPWRTGANPIGDCLNAGQSLRLLQGDAQLDALAFGVLAAARPKGSGAPAGHGSSLTRTRTHRHGITLRISLSRHGPLRGRPRPPRSPSPRSASPRAGRDRARRTTRSIFGQVHAAAGPRAPARGGHRRRAVPWPARQRPERLAGTACVAAAYDGDLAGRRGALRGRRLPGHADRGPGRRVRLRLPLRVDHGPGCGRRAARRSSDGYQPEQAGSCPSALRLGARRDADGTRAR